VLAKRFHVATTLIADGLLLVDDQWRTEFGYQGGHIAAIDFEVARGIMRSGDRVDKSVGQDSLQTGKHGYVTTQAQLVE